MTSLPITIVAAVAKNGALGKNNRLIWRVPTDLKRFKDITLGKPMIMGRKTYESIGRPLPGRQTIVVTRTPEFLASVKFPDLHCAKSLDEAIAKANDIGQLNQADDIILAGGAQLYAIGMDRASRMRLTILDCSPDADAFFPKVDPNDWIEICREAPTQNAGDQFSMEFIDYRRI